MFYYKYKNNIKSIGFDTLNHHSNQTIRDRAKLLITNL